MWSCCGGPSERWLSMAAIVFAGDDGVEFRPIEKSDKAIVDSYLRLQEHENSHFTFMNLYTWRKPFQVELAEENGVLFINSRWNGEVQAVQPFGPREKISWAIGEQLAWFRQRGLPFKVVDVEAEMAGAYTDFRGAELIAETSRDEADYVYLTSELIKLSGRKYHTRKNHLNSFYRDYPEAEYLPLTARMTGECMTMLEAWQAQYLQENPDDVLIEFETEAVSEILADFDYFGIKGGVIRLDGRIIAFAFGEQLNADTAVIHLEKADHNIRGAYAAINQGFAAHEWSGLTYINREEDMGLPGLRQAKESYHPVKMIEKYFIREAAD